MVICKKCGAEVAEGKFCENCGSILEAAPAKSEKKSVKYCPNCGAVVTGNFCEECGTKVSDGAIPIVPVQNTTLKAPKTNIFSSIGSKIGEKVGNIATDLTAIKSNYNNGAIIYKVEKIPNIKSKKVVISTENEIAYITMGNAINSYSETQIIEEKDFGCYFIKRKTQFTSPFVFEFDPMIKNLTNKDKAAIKVTYNVDLSVVNNDNFIKSLIKEMPSTWTEESLNDFIHGKINDNIKNTIIKCINDDGGLDLKDANKQISNFIDEAKKIFSDEFANYTISINNFNMLSADMDIDAINEVLIDNLYKA